MLTLLTGHSGTGKTTRIADCIRHDIADGHRVFLIVPEQQTVSVEREMACILPASAPLSFEVVNFTRLADTVFRMHGGLANVTSDASLEQLIMWRTLTELSPMLHSRVEAEPKNIAKMRSIVNELRGMCMTPAVLSEAATKSEGNLHDKLEDYALISSTYHALLTEYTGDASDCLDLLAEQLSAHPFPDGTKFYIDNFSSFTKQEYGVIEALLRHADITVALTTPLHTILQLSGAEVEDTRTSLTHLAALVETELKTEHLTTSHRLGTGARAYVAEHLFRADYATLPPYTGDEHDVSLTECPDPLDACDYIAADIRRRVMDEGLSYRDFAVVCGSTSGYEGILDTAFDKYDIPVFFSKRQDMLSLEPVKMILAAYDVIGGGWRREDVIAYLKCAPLNISLDVRDELEIYSETWNLHGTRWYEGGVWNMNPFGYGTPYSDGQKTYAAAKLERVNQAREKLVPPLHTLSEMTHARHTVTEHIRALTEFLIALSLPEHLDARAEELKRRDHASATEYARLWDVICDTLDAMNRVLGDMTVTADEFASQLHMLFSGVKLGAIPATLDEVTVGEARMLRAGEVKHVYLLGVNEGEFPPPPTPELSFTETERMTLADAGIETSDSIDARTARELYAFARAFNTASDHVTLLWSRAGISLEAAAPSDAVLRIRHLLGKDYPVTIVTPTDMLRGVSTPAAAGERLGQARGTEEGAAINRALSDDRLYAGVIAALDEPICNDERALSPALAATLWPSDLAMTQSRIQKLKECPFSYFCNYVLKLEDSPRAEFNAASIGDFIHAVLEHFFKLVKKRGMDPHTIPPEEQEALLREVEAYVISETLPPEEQTSPRTKTLLASLAKSAAAAVRTLCEEFRHSRFAPAFFELSIDRRSEDTPNPVTFALPDGSDIYIYGKIDRVDTYCENDTVYIRVVDYKTGVKKFSLKDIEEGINLQLLLYLYAIIESDSPAFRRSLGITDQGDILPAAVLYLSSLTGSSNAVSPRNEEETQLLGEKIAQRSGLVVNDPAVISALDDTEKKEYLPISLNKDGSVSKRSLGSLTDIAALGELKKSIGETLSAIGAALKRGDASARPMKEAGKTDACTWCSYKSVCRYTAPDKNKSRDNGQIKTTPEGD